MHCNFYIDYEGSLPKPPAPNVDHVGYRTIQLRFNSTELENRNDIYYILEMKPDYGSQVRGERFAVFPYFEKYHYVSIDCQP